MEQNLPFDLDALLVFGKVVESRSLSKAAALLGMPKSTVSRKLTQAGIRPRHQAAAQEHPSAHRHRPRREGLRPRREHPDARPTAFAPWWRAASRSRRASCGSRYRSSSASTTPPGSAPRSCSAIPTRGLDIRLVDNMVDPIKDGFDVVFGTGPLQDSTLIARKVFSLELFLCASPDFVEQLAEPLDRSDAAEQRCPSSTSASAGRASSRWPSTSGDTSCRHRYGLAPTTFRCASSTSCRGSASARCPRRSSAPTNCATAPSCRCLPEWHLEPLDVHMIYPFELSFSTLISAFYEAACEIIVENIARS